jgi:serine/threonine protein phosphatase PrpC
MATSFPGHFSPLSVLTHREAVQWNQTSLVIQGLIREKGLNPQAKDPLRQVRSTIKMIPIHWLSLFVHELTAAEDPAEIESLIKKIFDKKKEIDAQMKSNQPMTQTNEFYTEVCLPFINQKDPTGEIQRKVRQGWTQYLMGGAQSAIQTLAPIALSAGVAVIALNRSYSTYGLAALSLPIIYYGVQAVAPCLFSTAPVPNRDAPIFSPPTEQLSPDIREHRTRSPEHIEQSLIKKQRFAQESCDSEQDHPDFVQADRVLPRMLEFPDPLQSESAKAGSYSYGVCHYLGSRRSMEDEHIASSFPLQIQGRTIETQIFAILDGHNGKDAALMVRARFQHELQNQILSLEKTQPEWTQDQIIWNALKLAFVSLSDQYHGYAGTTASIVLIVDGQLWVANAGDSRAFMDQNKTLIALTEDMKPAKNEMLEPITPAHPDPIHHTHYTQRILNRGGSVIKAVIPRVEGNLAVAGSIGDHDEKSISARPAITRFSLTGLPRNTFLYLGCDGVFDVASSRQIAKLGRNLEAKRKSCKEMAEAIVTSAFISGSTDNISAMAVRLS